METSRILTPTVFGFLLFTAILISIAHCSTEAVPEGSSAKSSTEAKRTDGNNTLPTTQLSEGTSNLHIPDEKLNDTADDKITSTGHVSNIKASTANINGISATAPSVEFQPEESQKPTPTTPNTEKENPQKSEPTPESPISDEMENVRTSEDLQTKTQTPRSGSNGPSNAKKSGNEGASPISPQKSAFQQNINSSEIQTIRSDASLKGKGVLMMGASIIWLVTRGLP